MNGIGEEGKGKKEGREGGKKRDEECGSRKGKREGGKERHKGEGQKEEGRGGRDSMGRNEHQSRNPLVNNRNMKQLCVT